jgi:hypothetical protein
MVDDEIYPIGKKYSSSEIFEDNLPQQIHKVGKFL